MPPLALKATRVGLLAWSYEDALFPERGESTGGGKFGSRVLTVNEPLWDRGSYREFQRELERLRETARSLHASFYAAFINETQAPNHDARVALATLTTAMPSFIYVPAVVSEARGYRPVEAVLYDRKGRKAA